MKRLVLSVVAVMSMAIAFAGNNKAEAFNMTTNMYRMGAYLNLTSEQYDKVNAIHDFFCEKMTLAATSSDAKKVERVREAVYGDFKLMKNVLTPEQYKKYLQLVNVTFVNRGLEAYLVK